MTESSAVGSDTRNLHWKNNNVGSTLLQKMGWKHGQGLGKRRRKSGNDGANVSDDGDNNQQQQGEEHFVSSEGLKITKRRDGLGLGASHQANPETTGHHHLEEILQNLKREHGANSEQKKKKKRKSDNSDDKGDKEPKRKKKKQQRETILPTNKITHSRVRQAKFAAKTSEDMACIFGIGAAVAALPALEAVRVSERGSVAGRRCRSLSDDDDDNANGGVASKTTKLKKKIDSDDRRTNDTNDTKEKKKSGRKLESKDKEKKRSKKETMKKEKRGQK